MKGGKFMKWIVKERNNFLAAVKFLQFFGCSRFIFLFIYNFRELVLTAVQMPESNASSLLLRKDEKIKR